MNCAKNNYENIYKELIQKDFENLSEKEKNDLDENFSKLNRNINEYFKFLQIGYLNDEILKIRKEEKTKLEQQVKEKKKTKPESFDIEIEINNKINDLKKENQKFSRKRREKLKKDENRQPESKTAMISVILVASALSISLMARSYALEEKIGDYKSQRKEVKAQISAEEQRTKEIEALKEYMQSDEYAKQVAREKLGLVEGDEIIFKEK